MKNFKLNNGFTLVEILIAVALFVTVATVSIGAVLSIFDANKKARSSKTVVDNLNLSIENMARTIRFGANYYCGISEDNSVPIETSNCPNGGDAASVTFEGSRIIYRLYNGILQRKIGSDEYENLTSSDTNITYLKFYVFGSTPGDTSQPYVVAIIKGYVGTRPTNKTEFSIQTLMSQRTLDM